MALAYVLILLMAPKDIADYTVADTEYWHETGKRLMLKTAYQYNSPADIRGFPKTIGEWKGIDYRYQDDVYKRLNADILMSRAYAKEQDNEIIWMDIINSKVGESFHKQKICVEGSGWNIDNESTAEFTVAGGSNPFTKLYANRIDLSKGSEKQVMVYWFMFKKFGTNSSDAVTMIRLSAPVRDNDTGAAFSSVRGFVENQLFSTMYESALKENPTVAEYVVAEYGKPGMIAVILAVLAPLGMVVIGIRMKEP